MYDARVVDLSEGGARIEGSIPLPVGSHGRLHAGSLSTSVGFTVLARNDNEIRVSFYFDNDNAEVLRRFLVQFEQAEAA